MMEKPTTQEVEYEGKLTGTLDEEIAQENVGKPYSPIQTMWQVNPGAEALPTTEEERPNPAQ